MPMIDCAVHLRWQDIKKVWHQTDYYRHGNDIQIVDPPQGDEPLRFSFERKQHGFELRLYLFPAEAMRLETLWIELPHPVDDHARVLVHGFQSWSENGVWSMQEGRKSLNPFFGPFMRRSGLDGYGDYRFVPYDDDAGEFHSHFFASIQQDSNERHSAFFDSARDQDFFGSTEEDLAYGVFRFRDDAVTFERDVEHMVVLPGGRLGGIAQTLFSEMDVSLIPTAFQTVPALGLCVAGVYCARGKLFDCLEEWRPQQGGQLHMYDSKFVQHSPNLGDAEAGWTSRNPDGVKADENFVRNCIEFYKKNATEPHYVQIGDAYMTSVGDWLKPDARFTKGLADIARFARENGTQPAIWIAPFLAAKKSEIYREHPDWIVRQRDHDTWLLDPGVTAPEPGAAYSGQNYRQAMELAPKARSPRVVARSRSWGGAVYALDILNPDFRKHLAQICSVLRDEYGFALIEADFLFASGLVPRHGLTRAALTSFSLQLLRSWTSGAKLLLNGVPIASAMGRGDYVRSASDAGQWDQKFFQRIRFQERQSARNAIIDDTLRCLLSGRGFKTESGPVSMSSNERGLSANEREARLLTSRALGQLSLLFDDPEHFTPEDRHKYPTQVVSGPRILTRWQMSGSHFLGDLRIGREGPNFRLAVNWSDSPYRVSLYEGTSISANWWLPLRGSSKIAESFWAAANERQVILLPRSALLLAKLPAEPDSDDECVIVWSDAELFPGSRLRSRDMVSTLNEYRSGNMGKTIALAVPSAMLQSGMPPEFVDLGIRLGAWAIFRAGKEYI